MRVALYSPYLDTFGGGEKYILTIAETLSKIAEVGLLFDNYLFLMGADDLKDDLGKRFDLDLSKVKTIKAPIGKNSSFLERLFFLKKYDLLFYVTDGSIFYSTAKKNILHIQSPLVGQPAKSWWGKIKLKGWDLIIYNSEFTKDNSQKNWPITSKIIYPPVDTAKIKPLKKKKYILTVGRFFSFLKDKKHEVLIRIFRELYQAKVMEGWSMHLVGSAGTGDREYIEELKMLAKGIPVKFYPNLRYDDLVKLYGEASIYWHASGFEEDDPIKMEHFGIATVEAMSAGCVPVVIGKGGQLEIVEDKISGYLWNSLEELKKLTINLTSNNQLREKISKEVIKRSTNFSKEKFASNLVNLIARLN